MDEEYFDEVFRKSDELINQTKEAIEKASSNAKQTMKSQIWYQKAL